MAASVFFSYSHEDLEMRNQIEKRLAGLKRKKVIETWHDRRTGAGEEFAGPISKHIESDDIILLLVSPDFLDSEYCYEIEMPRAMARHEAGEAVVIPVILRACHWRDTPFGKINATPPHGKPITQYPDRDVAYLEVAEAIGAAADRLSQAKPSQSTRAIAPAWVSPTISAKPRSSHLSLPKTFTEGEKTLFLLSSFFFLAEFFYNSLDELAARNDGVESFYLRVDTDRFIARINFQGKIASRCEVTLNPRGFRSGIAYSDSVTSERDSYDEILNVVADDRSLFLGPLIGTALVRRGVKLTKESAAEFYWARLIGSFITTVYRS